MRPRPPVAITFYREVTHKICGRPQSSSHFSIWDAQDQWSGWFYDWSNYISWWLVDRHSSGATKMMQELITMTVPITKQRDIKSLNIFPLMIFERNHKNKRRNATMDIISPRISSKSLCWPWSWIWNSSSLIYFYTCQRQIVTCIQIIST